LKQRRALSELPRVQKAIAAVERSLGKTGRVLVRFSGTENKVRVLVEGPDAKRTRAHADAIAATLLEALG
jgi:phosphoglucosamine mutase